MINMSLELHIIVFLSSGNCVFVMLVAGPAYPCHFEGRERGVHKGEEKAHGRKRENG